MIFKISYLTKIYVGWPLLLDGFLWLVGNTGEERIVTFPNSMACWFHGWVRQGASSQNCIQMYSCTFAQKVPSVLFSHSIMSDSLWSRGLQHASLLCPSPTPGACSNSCPSSRWCHPIISSSVVPFCLQSFSASESFQGVSSLDHVAKVLELQLQHQSFQWLFRTDFLLDWLVWSPCSPRDSQESSPVPQFRSINFLALSFLYGPTLSFIHDYWKNLSFDYMDRCW